MAIGKEFERKLKRGLQDLSPLFQAPVSSVAPTIVSPSSSFDVQFVTVCMPEHVGDAFLANAYLASQLVRRTALHASLVSIAPGFNTFQPQSKDPFPSLEFLDPRISRLVLSHQELWGLSRDGPMENESKVFPASPEEAPSCLVFLEFEPSEFQSLARIALLLDRVVLFVEPRVENLREAYRFIKVLWNHNPEIEFFLLFRGRSSVPQAESFLFERFSLITSRFLGLYCGWLGDLSMEPEDSTRCNLEPLLSGENLRRPLSPEKNRLWHELRRVAR